MDIMSFTTGAIATNTYCFPVAENAYCLVDPGGDGDDLIVSVRSMGGTVSHTILTHGHFDHISALRNLRNEFPEMKVWIHEDDAYRLGEDGYRVACEEFARIGAFGFVKEENYPTPTPDALLKEGDVIFQGSVTFPGGLQVLSTPGHSNGSVCFFSAEKNIMFTGDTMFAYGSFGRTDCDTGDDRKLQKSLKRILSFPDEVKILPGHERESTLSVEKKYYSQFGF